MSDARNSSISQREQRETRPASPSAQTPHSTHQQSGSEASYFTLVKSPSGVPFGGRLGKAGSLMMALKALVASESPGTIWAMFQMAGYCESLLAMSA